MSVTAFPVLARILKERKLLGTNLGTISISCAAIDDISAWLLLAVLTAVVHSAQSWRHLAMTLLLLVIFVFIMAGSGSPGSVFTGTPISKSKARGWSSLSSLVLYFARGQLDDGPVGSPRSVRRVHGGPDDAHK